MENQAFVQRTRLLLVFEAACFAFASLIHSGMLISGYEHFQASTAEGVIAAVLLAGLAVSVARQDWTRRAGLGVQWFALLGTFVGLFTIAIGVGPRSLPDLIFHAVIVFILVWGLITTTRAGRAAVA